MKGDVSLAGVVLLTAAIGVAQQPVGGTGNKPLPASAVARLNLLMDSPDHPRGVVTAFDD